MSKIIRETSKTLAAATIESSADGLDIQIVTPGWGSSGYYAPEVLEAAAADKVFPAGTQMYFDHPTESEKEDHPERSVLRIGAVLREDASWDGTRLHAVADPIAVYRELLEDETFQKAIGVSIRAAAEVSTGENDGRKGTIIERLVASNETSVDFVTHAGRGGAFGAALESARPSMVVESAIRRGVSEATVNDQREALSTVIRDAYNADNTWVWLRDFDDTTAWFEVEDDEGAAVWQQTYSKGDDGLANALTGERIEVRVSTQYVPVDSAGQSNTQESKEDTMPQIEEARLRQLEEDAGRVTALESERDTEKKRAELAESRTISAISHARTQVREANADLPASTIDRIIAEATRGGIPATQDGALDTAEFDKRLDTAREAEETYLAGLASESGSGTIKGFGATESSSADGEISVDDFDNAFKED
jgi:hypothetical protein